MTKQVEELIIKKSGKDIPITAHTAYFANEFKQKVSRKVHVNTASKEEKDNFKKRLNRYLWTDNNDIKRKNGLP